MVEHILPYVLLVSVTVGSSGKTLAVLSTNAPPPPPEECLPCDLPMELTASQMHQAELVLNQIWSASDPPSAIPRVQSPVVSLDELQKSYVMQKYGVMFSSEPPSMDDDGVVDTPTRSLHRGRRNPANHYRVCPPDGDSYTPLNIGYNVTGSPVQIVQFYDYKQWFLEEKCDPTPSPVNLGGDVICKEVNRTNTALVINLENPELGIHHEFIRVQSCASFRVIEVT